MSENQESVEHLIHGATSMTGDLMSMILDMAKALPKPWQQMSEVDQEMWLEKVDIRVTAAVEKCVNIIASRDAAPFPAVVDSVTFKSGVKISLKMDKASEGAHQVADHTGHSVLITVVETADLVSDNHKPTADKDQPQIPFKPEGEDA